MISRVIGALGAWLRRVWSAAGGVVGRQPGRQEQPAVKIVARREPRSVVGIALHATLAVVGVGLALVLAYQLRLLLILIFLAVLLAAGIHGPVLWLERRGLPRIAAVLSAYLALALGVGLVVFLIVPPLVREAIQFADDLPSLFDRLRSGAVDLIDGVAGQGRGDEIVDTFTAGAGNALPQIGSLIAVPLTLAGVIANIVVTIFLSALLLIERDRIRGWFLEFVDEDDRPVAINVARHALLRLGAYVRGQLLVMTVIGVGSALGMVVVGWITTGEPLPFAIPLGALSFIGAAIPLAGAFIAGAPILLVALTVSPLAALLMLGWLIVLQQLEGNVVTPIVQGRAVSLSAVAVLLGVVAGTSLAGIVGGIIAIPVVAVADVVLREVYFPLRRQAEQRRLQAVEAEAEAEQARSR